MTSAASPDPKAWNPSEGRVAGSTTTSTFDDDTRAFSRSVCVAAVFKPELCGAFTAELQFPKSQVDTAASAVCGGSAGASFANLTGGAADFFRSKDSWAKGLCPAGPADSSAGPPCTHISTSSPRSEKIPGAAAIGCGNSFAVLWEGVATGSLRPPNLVASCLTADSAGNSAAGSATGSGCGACPPMDFDERPTPGPLVNHSPGGHNFF